MMAIQSWSLISVSFRWSVSWAVLPAGASLPGAASLRAYALSTVLLSEEAREGLPSEAREELLSEAEEGLPLSEEARASEEAGLSAGAVKRRRVEVALWRSMSARMRPSLML